MNYDAIIFDIDGTLWNTVPACTKGWNLTLERLETEERITIDQMISVMGTPQDEAVEKLLPQLHAQHTDLVKAMSECEEEVLMKEGGEFYAGILEEVKGLSEHTPIFLVSNCQSWYLDVFIRLSGLADYLTDADCWGKAHQTKTQMLQGLQQKHGFKQGVYIGDTLRDQVAAKQAGFDFIYAAYGFGEVEGADVSFEDSEELVEYLK